VVDASLLAKNERERLDAVRRYDVLDTPPDGAFDRLTAVAARLFGVPIAIVSIVDEDRIWFKSHHGLDVDEIGRDPGLCASAILGDQPWLVTDARNDPRALANPLVAGAFGLGFYAGVPLRTHDGFNLGTLCVIDHRPREVNEHEVASLADLAAVVIDELELRLSARRTVGLEAQLRRQAEAVSATLQESLVPPVLPTTDGLEIASRYHVALRDEAGGDFYDVIPTEWGVGMLVGDACGKGAMAAAVAGMARWTLHTLMVDDREPADSLRRLNAVLCGARPGGGSYVTAVAVAMRSVPGGRELSVAVGGHPRPLVVRADGTVDPIDAKGPIIGWFPDSRYEVATALLSAGDTIVLFTDGLLEAIAGHGETDDAPIRDVLGGCGGRRAEEVANRLDEAMADSLRDDAAFLVVRVL
jgi:sigma-B regulation protein RsbU (phosphoserine phosphatase)